MLFLFYTQSTDISYGAFRWVKNHALSAAICRDSAFMWVKHYTLLDSIIRAGAFMWVTWTDQHKTVIL